MNKTENKLVPELRFPEFINDGEWKEKKLSQLAEIKGRIGFRGYTINDIVNKGSGAITLSPSNIDENGTLNFEKSTYISWFKYEESPEIKLEEGQTVLVKTASVGKTAYIKNLPEKATVNPQIVVLKPTDINPLFLSYIIAHKSVQDQIKSNVGAGAIPNLSQDSISKFNLLIPSLPNEQQKIADCLSSLDEAISAHSDKLEALKNHKKGLLQNLFPQEGETVPKYRFPEFKNDGKWEEKSLGKLLLRKPEYGINAPASPYSDNLPTYLRITDISEEGNFLSNNKVSVDRDVSEINYLLKGDIVLARTGASVGKSYMYREKDGKLVFAGFLIRVSPNNKKLNSEFLFQFLSTSQYWKWVSFISARSGQPGINGTEYSSMPINIPPNIKEQQKIADCLSEVDNLITAQTNKIEQLKAHKNGLMQRLFPKA
ncbi:hypothetical protein CMT45_04680 [Elizabethkingia anophelis]|nr:hypothetical protein [Elizabethkingia anophelis]